MRSRPKAMLTRAGCSNFFASGSVFLSSMPYPILTSAQFV
jgi:hypothetical protein